MLGKSSFYHPMVDDTAIATPTQKMVPWVPIEWPATMLPCYVCWDGSRWRLSNHLQITCWGKSVLATASDEYRKDSKRGLEMDIQPSNLKRTVWMFSTFPSSSPSRMNKMPAFLFCSVRIYNHKLYIGVPVISRSFKFYSRCPIFIIGISQVSYTSLYQLYPVMFSFH